MNRLKYIGIGLGVVLTSLLAFAGVAQAQSVKTGQSVTVAANETVDSMLFATGSNIDIAGTVNGDVYCAGQNVTISGTVHGDIFCAGQNVALSGKVDGSARLAGQNVTVSGSTTGSLTVGAQTFLLEKSGSVGVDLLGGTQSTTLNGTVLRDVTAGATNLTIDGDVGRNVTSAIDNLTIGSSGKVGGNLEYTSNNTAVIKSGGQVAGTTTKKTPENKPHSAAPAILKLSILGFGYIFISMLIVALVLVLLFPSVFQAASTKAFKQPGRTALIGLIAIFAAPVVITVVMVTLVGIPLGIILLLMWLLVALLSGPFSAYFIGHALLKDSRSPVLIMLVGASLLVVSYFIPVIGFFTLFAAYLFGTGMFLAEAMRRVPNPSHKVS